MRPKSQTDPTHYPKLELANPEVVVDLLKGKPPALVIINVTLPGISGHDAMLKFRQLCPNVPVLMISGLPDVDVICEWQGQDGFAAFPKPFSPHVRAKVREMIGMDTG